MVNNDFPVTVEAGSSGPGPAASASASTAASSGRSAPGALLTVAEVAGLMRVSNMTVYRLIKAGELAAVRVGHSYRIREGEIERYLSERSVRVGGDDRVGGQEQVEGA